MSESCSEEAVTITLQQIIENYYMSQSRLTYLFNRYINKEHTPEEQAELFRLIETGDINEALKELLDKLIQETGAGMRLPESSGDKILQAIIGVIPEKPVEIPVYKKRLVPVWAGIAAASVLLIGIFTWFIFLTGETGKSTDESVAVKATEPALVRISTVTGEGKKIRLPDSTEVWLSPSSTLEYPSVFAGTLREVKLSGEAFFEVTHDKSRPFIIHSGNIETKVLGTSFNIQAYDNQEEINVTVVTGKVNVSNRDKVENVDIVANQRAVFHRSTTTLVKENADATAAPVMLKRKEGEFIYQNERLQKVIDDIHEYFGTSIQVADAVKECPVTLNFYLSGKIEEILEPISLMINGSIQEKEDVFFIDGKACPRK
ncbi:MAG: FecR domain-containing protein [Agriterribacter sp.]